MSRQVYVVIVCNSCEVTSCFERNPDYVDSPEDLEFHGFGRRGWKLRNVMPLHQGASTRLDRKELCPFCTKAWSTGELHQDLVSSYAIVESFCDWCGTSTLGECKPSDVLAELESQKSRLLSLGWKLKRQCRGSGGAPPFDYCPRCIAKLPAQWLLPEKESDS